MARIGRNSNSTYAATNTPNLKSMAPGGTDPIPFPTSLLASSPSASARTQKNREPPTSFLALAPKSYDEWPLRGAIARVR
jgi:hypothetical protein